MLEDIPLNSFMPFLLTTIAGASSFVVRVQAVRHPLQSIARAPITPSTRTGGIGMVQRPSARMGGIGMVRREHTGTKEHHAWAPQDLTKSSPGRTPIPDDDYVKKYQQNPELWPVEFFLVAYRRSRNKETQQPETQVLVRESANGTSKWGVGTGVPATRWVLSTQERPPLGYKWSEPRVQELVPAREPLRVRLEASSFPEFPRNGQESWTYDKIDIREDAFNGPDATLFHDPELEEYANQIREGLRKRLSEQVDFGTSMSSWEASRLSVVKGVVDNANSLAAIQGTLRMSGLFARKAGAAAGGGAACPRYVCLGERAPDHAKLVQSMRIFTMFPQMPDPMPLPSTPSSELQEEIMSRESRMAESGRDPHEDAHGRKYTHKSTSNVSNTIHGVYLTLDATDLPGLDEVPAFDLVRMPLSTPRPPCVSPRLASDPLILQRGRPIESHLRSLEQRNSSGNGNRSKISRCWTRKANASAQRTQSRHSSLASLSGSSSRSRSLRHRRPLITDPSEP